MKAAIPPEQAAADAAEVGITGKLVGHADLGQDLLDHKARVAVTQSVVLEAAVQPFPLILVSGRQHAWVDEDADRDRHLALVDQVVENDRSQPRFIPFGL